MEAVLEIAESIRGSLAGADFRRLLATRKSPVGLE
jgi:hypothetical protein